MNVAVLQTFDTAIITIICPHTGFVSVILPKKLTNKQSEWLRGTYTFSLKSSNLQVILNPGEQGNKE
jgi:hypothetical protein